MIGGLLDDDGLVLENGAIITLITDVSSVPRKKQVFVRPH
ncbi:hypothetical protein EVA_05752 [gut metagenome]|uniref:Uncharacterized protein n=1 Tax=gut metagenome TaxID=749906 RepID=J9GGN8_9ZZZZ